MLNLPAVKLIFRDAAHIEEDTGPVLKTHNSHASIELAINDTLRRFLIRVGPGSLSFFYGKNAKKLTPDDVRSTPGVFRFCPTFWAFSVSATPFGAAEHFGKKRSRTRRY